MTKPNVLVVMTDQQAPQFTGVYGHPIAQTPHLDRLAREGVVFDNAYTNCPICVPSRMSFLTGRRVQNIGIWDNGVPLREDATTWPHRLRSVGYNVALAGKAHFRGHDHLHGFEEQLAYDINAANRPKPPNWSASPKPRERTQTGMPRGAGHTAEHDADNAVEAAALNYINDPARQEKPWALLVGFVCPHNPYIAPKEYLDRYPVGSIDLPDVPAGHGKALHPHCRRIQEARGIPEDGFDPQVVKEIRASYYALVTFIDDKLGRMLKALEETGQIDNTVVVFTSDHGDMMGEHAMFLKSCYYEHSSRVPMVMRFPEKFPAGKRIRQNVSLVDLTRALVDLAGAPDGGEDGTPPLDGDSLAPLAEGKAPNWKDEAFGEYCANFTLAPTAMLKKGRYKLNWYHREEPELYDLEEDPGERRNLAKDPRRKDELDALEKSLMARWDPNELETAILASQEERRFLEPYLFPYLEETPPRQ